MPCQPDFQISVSLQTAFTHLTRRLQRSFPGIQIIRVKKTPGFIRIYRRRVKTFILLIIHLPRDVATDRHYSAPLVQKKKTQKQFGFSLWTQHPD